MSTAATWSVRLGGQFVPYDPAINAQIEEQYQKNELDVEVTVRGTAYQIDFGELRQKQVSDTTRQRIVKRERPLDVAEPEPKRQQLDENSSGQAPPAAAAPPAAEAAATAAPAAAAAAAGAGAASTAGATWDKHLAGASSAAGAGPSSSGGGGAGGGSTVAAPPAVEEGAAPPAPAVASSGEASSSGSSGLPSYAQIMASYALAAPPAAAAPPAVEEAEEDEVVEVDDEPEPPLQPPPQAAAPPAVAAPPAPAAPAAIVFAPGAGGSTAKAMVALHEQLEARGIRVFRCDPGNAPNDGFKGWATNSAGCGRNVGRVKNVCELAAQSVPNATIFLVGSSFGNRVICEAMRSNRAELPARVSHKMVCTGYPLHGDGNPEGADPKRLNSLRNLPASTEVLFLSGKYDTHLGKEGRGLASLRDVMAQMACTATLVEVPCGVHTVPNVTQKRELRAQHDMTEAQVAALVRDTIANFVS